MKRSLIVSLAAGLLILSSIQFRPVAAAPDDADEVRRSESGLRVVEPEIGRRLDSLQQRLDEGDAASVKLRSLIDSEAGRIALAGWIEQLRDRLLHEDRADAVPRFVDTFFEVDSNGKLSLRPEHRGLADSWVDRSRQLGQAVQSIQERLQAIADRMGESDEVDRLAKRFLSDPHLGFVLLVQEFNGRSDPIDLYLDRAMEKVLVRRGDQMIVIPSLGADGEQRVERLELAGQAFKQLKLELPAYANEFAKPDDRHRRFIGVMNTEAAAAVIALRMAKENRTSAAAAIDELFDRLEQASRDTANGLVIESDDTWNKIGEIMDQAERSKNRAEAVQSKLNELTQNLDVEDPLTARFAAVLRSGVLAYQVALEIPYAELDLGKQVEATITAALEPDGGDRFKVKRESTQDVMREAHEWLTACRTVRRYLRRVDSLRARMSDRDLAASLGGPGRMLLLAEIRRNAENATADPLELLEKELFVESAGGKRRVRPDRSERVDELAVRATKLQQELSNDDF